MPIVQRLVQLGADVNVRDKNHNKTALDYAKSAKHQDVILWDKRPLQPAMNEPHSEETILPRHWNCRRQSALLISIKHVVMTMR